MIKAFYKIISLVVLVAIIYFLFDSLIANWEKIKDYDFTFNYFYLAISILFLTAAFAFLPYAWNRILKAVNNNQGLSYKKALKIYTYSDFGKYLPGKVWTLLGKIYLGAQEGLPKKVLSVSSYLDAILALLASLIVGLLGVAFYLIDISLVYFSASIIAVILGLIFIHPKIFYSLFNIILKKINKEPIPQEDFISYDQILDLLSTYFIVSILYILAFFFLIGSLFGLQLDSFLITASSYLLGSSLGTIAVFAPSGVGVREGVMVVILKSIFSLPMAIFISFVARIWFTVCQLLLFVVVFIMDKNKKHELPKLSE